MQAGGIVIGLQQEFGLRPLRNPLQEEQALRIVQKNTSAVSQAFRLFIL